MGEAQTTWKSDWRTFVSEIANRFSQGDSEKVLTDSYGGNVVRWSGVVLESNLDSEIARGVELQLPEFRLPTRDGLTLVAGYVALFVNEKTARSWSDVRPGDVVEFECMLGKGHGPFPGVQIAVFDEDNECVLKPYLENATLVRKMKS